MGVGIDALTPETARLVRVDWEDIYFSDNWSDDEAVQPVESTTVGYLIHETPTVVVVAGSYDWRNGQWGTVHAIPRGEISVSDLGAAGSPPRPE